MHCTLHNMYLLQITIVHCVFQVSTLSACAQILQTECLASAKRACAFRPLTCVYNISYHITAFIYSLILATLACNHSVARRNAKKIKCETITMWAKNLSQKQDVVYRVTLKS